MYPADITALRQRELELRLRDALGGLAQFTLDAAKPAGWLTVEILTTPHAGHAKTPSATVVPMPPRRSALA